jgi:hypothetical protein
MMMKYAQIWFLFLFLVSVYFFCTDTQFPSWVWAVGAASTLCAYIDLTVRKYTDRI